MRMTIRIALVAWIALGTLAACSDHGPLNVNPSITPSISGEPITKAELADAIWGATEGVSEGAACVADSSFTIEKAGGFDIMRDRSLSDWRSQRVIVVSSITVPFLDPTADARSPSCPPEGAIGYVVSASDQTPIAI
jgi:predicted small lipoprotein YifL